MKNVQMSGMTRKNWTEKNYISKIHITDNFIASRVHKGEEKQTLLCLKNGLII